MKHNSKLNRSRWLLLTLFTLLVGISPAWADSEDFESLTVDGTTLSNGWFVQGGTLKSTVTSITSSSSWGNYAGDYNYEMITQGANGTSKSICNYESSNTNKYLIIPVEVTGKIKYYAGGCRTSGTRYVKVYRVTYDSGNSTYSIGAQIGSTAWPSARGSSSAAPNWLANKQEVDLGDDHTMIAFLLQGSAIDEVEYEVYVSTPYVAPASISVVPSGNSAIITWTAGATEETVTAWNLEYKKSSDDVWSEVHGIAAGTLSQEISGLNDNTDYDVRVKAIYGTEESVWKTTTFKTPRAPITSFPWSEDFSGLTSGNIPDGWDNTEGTTTTASYKWTYYNSGNTAAPCLRFNSYNNSSNKTNFLKTPAMSFTQNAPMQLKFWYKNPTGGDFSIYISNDGGATYTEELASGLTGASSWTEKVIDLPTDEYYNNVVIVFKGTSNYGSGDAYIYLDDVLVKENAGYAMSISGEDVSENTIAFGEVKNTSTTKTFTISNDGANDLTGVSVVSSEEEVFTVSDTDFNIAAGGTKDITVTFVKGVVGSYEETITVSQANLASPIVLSVTGSYATPSAAEMVVKDGEEVIGETVAFGNIGKTKSKTITITNTGEADLNITSITSSNTTDFTVSPSALTVHGGSSETFTVTFIYDAEALDAEKTATITVTASNEGIEAKQFTVTGTRIEQWSEDFSGGTLPDGWEITNGTYWKIQDGVAKGSYSYGNFDLYTPSLVVEEGATLTFDYRMTSTYRSLDIQYSKDNGAWTNYATISYSGLTLNQWYTYNIENLTPGNYKFRFGDSNYDLDNFQGFKRNLNDPKMGIYSDAECTVAVATSVTNDFGFATTDQTVSYYIKNDGTGTMTLSKGDNPAGFTATLDKTSVAAGEHATLTITMPAADNAGYHSGNIVVTATDLGDFTVAASGVIRDANKMYLDFSSDNIPATWTPNDWMKDNGGFIKTGQYGYSNTSMETSTLTAAAGEQLVIVAKNGSTSDSYTFGVKYKKVGDAEWSDLIASANIGTSWTTLVSTIAEAGDYLFQINGYYASIQRIYGLSEPSEPVMVVYDDEEVAGSSYNFGNVSDEADATWTLTVKNEGKAALTGLAAALSGTNAEHYSVQVSATELAVNATTTITVKQLKDNIGAHSATLTISADDLDSKVIALSGFTYDHNKMFVDFEGGSFPTGWTTNSWTVATTSGNKHARAGYTASSLITTPLTVGEDESLVFKAKRQYSGTAPTFQIRYTTNGGVTWSEYADYASQVTSGDFTNITLSGISAGTAIVEIYGRYVDLDDFYGFAPTTAPILSLTESAVAVASGSTKEFGNLTVAGTATYTLSNTGTANLVSTVATTGVATAAITGEGEGVTISENTVTLAPGKSATITLTLPYEAPYGEKAGAMTISSQGWVADMVVNYTATTIDPTALYVDFNDNTKPAGWYQEASGWTISAGRAHVYTGVTKALVTEQYAAEEGKNVLRFDAKLQSNYADGELKVYTSTDRKTWTLAKTVTLTNEDQQVALDALEDGNYYVKFESLNASIDNLTGLKRILPAPEHDLYVSASEIPTATKVPESSITATATVYSLRADETGVYAKLFFDETVVATADPQDISNGYSANFTLIGNVPATEKTYAAKIVVYYSDNSVAFETLTTNVEVAHTRTLSITSFTRDGEGEIDANASNQFSAAFNVTVQNTGSIAATPVVKIFIGETEVGSATADAEVAAGESKEIAVNVTNASAGEGGELAFTAKAFWTAEGEAKATSASDVVITVNAAAPKFNLNYKDGAALTDGDNVDYGLVKAATIKAFTISNTGTANLELVSIVAPTGYSATAVTEDNKNIAIDGSLDITVTLNAEQGKKSGDLVITYKVDESTNKTFTLHLSGRSVAADTWTETFDTEIPGAWTNNNWEWNEERQTAYSGGYNVERTLMTPCLTAEKDEVLTYDLTFQYDGYTVKVEYSTDYANWTEYATISDAEAGEQTFVAPAAGDYYLRFTATRYANLDNFVGFKLATTVPVTISQYGYTTFTSMYHINAEDLPDGIEAFYVKSDGVGGSYVHLTKAEGNIPAGTGLILKGTANEEYNLNIATGITTALEGNLMVGCLENTKLDADAESYVLINNTDEGRAEFQSLADYGITILAGKAYLKVPGAGGARLMIFDDGETTGISSVLRQQARDGRVYNLNGQRVENPKKGQLYIINGKQTVVK